MSQTYSFLDFNCALVGPGGSIALGNGSGAAEEGITFIPTGEISGMLIGADGTGQHSLYADKSGKITVRLLKTSPTNLLLSAMYNFQTASGATHGQNTIVGTDSSRGDVISCAQVAFAKAPDLTYAKDGGMVDWEFNAISIIRTLGS
jgi:Protein of unknown function (DUF3277)